MTKLFCWIGIFIGGWLGWQLGGLIGGFDRAFALSGLGSIAGVFIGWKIAQEI